MLSVSILPAPELLRAPEKRLKPLSGLPSPQPFFLFKNPQPFPQSEPVRGFPTMQGGAFGGDSLRVIADCKVSFRMKIEQSDKGIPQTGEKSERAAGEEDLLPNIAAACERGDHLEGHGVKDRCGDVLPGDPVAQKRLNIRFRKHPAARSDGAKPPAVSGQPVKVVQRNVEENRHLLDEGPRAASTAPVHTDVGLEILIE